MHLERIHEMIEDLTECAESAIKNDKTHVGKYPISEVIDMIKDLSEAEYHGKITHAMKEAEEEEEKENEYALKRMKEEYGEDEGLRYYNDWRYKSGRFAPKGRGMRRGYDEPPYYHMTPEMYREYPAEHWRDMDRMNGKMYYTETGTSSKSLNYGNSSMRTEMPESRYERAKRGYEETKAMHTENTPEDKQAKMKELEKYMNELAGDVTTMISDATPEERTLLKAKMQTLMQKF